MRTCFLLLSAVSLVGCASVRTLPLGATCVATSDETPIEAVEISNACWYLLALLPIASGDPTEPNQAFSCKWFTRTTTTADQMRMLEDEVHRVGGTKAVNVVTSSTDEDVFLFLLVHEKYHTTAVIVK